MINSLKALLTIIIFSFIAACSSPKPTETFSYEPLNPKPGDEVTVYYISDSTNLSDAKSIEMVTYTFNDELYMTIGVDMTKEKGYWKGKFILPSETFGALVKFKFDKIKDNNNKEGYSIPTFDEENKISSKFIAGKAIAQFKWIYHLDGDRDFETARLLFNEAVKQNPYLNRQYADAYLTILQNTESDFQKVIDTANLILPKIESLENKTEDDYSALVNWYMRIGNKEKAAQFKTELNNKFPSNDIAAMELYQSFRNEPDINRKLELLNEFEQKFPHSRYITIMYDLAVNYYRDNNEYQKARDLLTANANKPSLYRFYSVSSKILDDKGDAQIALEIANLGVQRGQEETNNPPGKQPEFFSLKEWKEENAYLLGYNLYAKAKALNVLSKLEEALPAAGTACKHTKGEEADINELFTELLLANGKTDEAISKIEEFIKTGKSTNAMKTMLHNAYIKKNGNDKGYADYFTNLEEEALGELYAKLKKDMISETAPLFSLLDLNGKEVSLESLKGKTVILDFWATWCGPCISSFPGMKKAVEKFSDNPNVKFLFINSWERVENKVKNAKDFITENRYPFHVLMDEENKVIAGYKVSGIPTKFIISPEGKIVFKAVGFDGNTDAMVNEISAMIKLADQS